MSNSDVSKQIINLLNQGSGPLRQCNATFKALGVFSSDLAITHLRNWFNRSRVTRESLTKKDRELLDQAAKKLGLNGFEDI